MDTSNIIDSPSGGSGAVLVTGGAGFLGAYIIQELVEKGYRVRAIRRSTKLPFYIPAPVLEQVEWIPGDILDVAGLGEAMAGMDAVIHAAAKISFAGSDRREMFHTNIEGTANTVNAAIEQHVSRFLHISSVAALSRTVKGELITEDKKWQDSRLNTSYAISKYHAELEVWRGIGEGLNATIVNPSTILGYGDWNTSSCAVFKTVFRGFPWYTNGMNGFVDVKDAARAVVALLATEAGGERFILSGDNWSFRQLFNGIAAGFGKKPPSREATPFLSAIAWRMETLRSLFSRRPSLLSRESARIAQSSTRFDNSRILQKLPGFGFTPLQQTVEGACKAYLDKLQPL
jgi:dihydroflavonol-4-reductase